jgi:E3 ubiquitin-protein ligase BRE1
MESRKRPYAEEDDEPVQTKKRLLTTVNGSPHVNGVVTEVEEPTDGDNLEVTNSPQAFCVLNSLYSTIAVSQGCYF